MKFKQVTSGQDLNVWGKKLIWQLVLSTESFFKGNKRIERCSNYDIYDIKIEFEFCSYFGLV